MLYFVHYVVNDFLVLVVNLGVDVRLVGVIKQNLDKKYAINAGKADEQRLAKEAKKKRSIEIKSNVMIVVSVILYVVCRVSELVARASLYGQTLSTTNDIKCQGALFCYLLLNAIEYLYMVSYLFNIIIYYKFNANFQKGLRRFLNLKTNDQTQ